MTTSMNATTGTLPDWATRPVRWAHNIEQVMGAVFRTYVPRPSEWKGTHQWSAADEVITAPDSVLSEAVEPLGVLVAILNEMLDEFVTVQAGERRAVEWATTAVNEAKADTVTDKVLLAAHTVQRVYDYLNRSGRRDPGLEDGGYVYALGGWDTFPEDIDTDARYDTENIELPPGYTWGECAYCALPFPRREDYNPDGLDSDQIWCSSDCYEQHLDKD